MLVGLRHRTCQLMSLPVVAVVDFAAVGRLVVLLFAARLVAGGLKVAKEDHIKKRTVLKTCVYRIITWLNCKIMEKSLV